MFELKPLTLVVAAVLAIALIVVFVVNIRRELK
jgi:hypothetical protein